MRVVDLAGIPSLVALAIFAVILLSGIASAGCSSAAYSSICNSCSFDERGKLNSTCYNRIKAEAITCYMKSYPQTYARYAAGNCSGVDRCINGLESCKGRETTGNDSRDCQGTAVAGCFAAADACMISVAETCEKVPDVPCGSFDFLVILFGAGIVAAAWKAKG